MKFLILFLTINFVNAKEITLKEVIASVKNHPDLSLVQVEIDKANLLYKKIDGEFGPKISLLGGIAPNKEVKGDATHSETSSSVNTQTYLTTIDLKWPLYAFGRTNDLTNANNENVKVKEIETKKKEAELIKSAKEYFYGLKYTLSLNDFAEGALKDLNEAIESLTKNKKPNEEEVLKLNVFRSLAQSKKYEVEKGMDLYLLGLRYITQNQTEELKVDEDWIEFKPREIPTLAELKNLVQDKGFDLNRARSGAIAKALWAQSEKKGALPVFGVFSKYDWMNTQGSTKQNSKFANDPYNKNDFSIGLGLLWEFDFGAKSSNIQTALIDSYQAQAQREFAEKNIPLKIEKVYLEYSEALKKATELGSAYKNAKRLFTKVSSGIVLGITPAKEIIETYTLKAEVYKNYLDAIYQYELKLAELSLEVGTELDPDLK